MASENTVGIGIVATSQLKEVFEGNIAATKELTTAIQALSEFLKTHATALSAVETAQKNITTSTKEITEAKKAEQTVLRDEAVTWDDLIAAANEEAGAQRQATQATKERAKADEDALVVRKALSKASADDRGWMGMTPKQNPDTENAAWLRYFETILKGTGDATVALQQLKRAQDEMSSPKAERDIFIGQQLDQLLQLNAAQVNADQVRRVLTGTTVEQIKAEEGLVQVDQPLVNALSQQAKLSGDLATARAVLNETLQTGIVTDTQRVQIQNAILKIDQDLAKAEQEKVSQELQLAELEARRLVAQNSLGEAITRLTEAQNSLNLSDAEKIRLATQIEQLQTRQQAQADRENEAEVRLLQTKARGELAAKNYAEAINLLTQAQDRAIPGTQQHAEVTNQLADAQRKAEAAANGAAGGIHSMWQQSFIFFGIAMGVNSAIQEIASTTGEKANPQLQTFSRVLQEVSSGAMVGMMSFGPMGMAIGALTGLALGATLAMGQLDEATIALNQSLASIAKKDDAIEALARMAGVSKEAAASALEYAKAGEDQGKQLQTLVKENEKAIPVLQGIGDEFAVIGDVLGFVKDKVVENIGPIRLLAEVVGAAATAFNHLEVGAVAAARALREGKDAWGIYDAARKAIDDADNSQQRLNKTVQEFSARGLGKAASDLGVIGDAVSKLDDEWAKANAKQLADALSTQQKILQAEQNAKLQREQLARDLAERQAEITYQSTQMEEGNLNDIMRANRTMADAIANANRELNDTLARDAQQLADKRADIEHSLASKLADEEHNYQKDLDSQNAAVLQAKQDLAQKLLDIDKKEAEDLAALDWQTHQDLENAKTDNEREKISERANFQRAQIRQGAEDERSKAERDLAEAETASAKKKELALDEHQYKMMLAGQEAAYSLAQAQREYAQEVEQAKLKNREQLEDTRLKNREELADLAFRHKQEEENIIHERDVAVQANRDRLNDLNARLQLEEAALLQMGTFAQSIAVLAAQSITDVFGSVTRAVQMGVNTVAAAKSELFHQTGANVWADVTGRAGGGDVWGGVTYKVGEEGPELLRLPAGINGTIIPNSQISNSYGGNVMNFYVNGAQDPRAVKEEIRRYLENELYR